MLPGSEHGPDIPAMGRTGLERRDDISVIVADDDAALLALLTRHLRDAGYQVVPCSNGLDALEQALGSQTVIVLADWDMPGLTGPDLCQRLRAEKPDGTAYIILLTAKDDREHVVAGLESGADDYLTKATSRAEMLARIRVGERIVRLLREQRERTSELEAVIEHHPAGIVILDAASRRIVRVNERACRLLDTPRQQAVGQAGDALIDGTELPDPEGEHVAAGHNPEPGETPWGRVEAGHVCHRETTRARADGAVSVIDITVAPVRVAGDRITHFVAIVQDITQRRRAEEDLRRAHARNEQLLAAISSILIGVDADGQVTEWNAAAETAFGISARDAVGRPLDRCGIRWDQTRVVELLERVRARIRPPQPTEIRFQRTDGTEGVLGIGGNPISWDSSKPTSVLLVAADVTKRKRLESQLAQAQKLESIGHLAAGIAHEINTPTQYVGDNTCFLETAFADLQALLSAYGRFHAATKDGPVSASVSAALEAALEAADLEYLQREIPQAISQSLEGIEHVTNIVRAMKDFSHPGEKEKQAADINRAIQSTITMARNEWKYVAEIETDLDPTLPSVSCWVADFNQAILNIIVNAAHAIRDHVGENAGAKGTIRVSTQHDDEGVTIRISDTGTGIPKEIRTRIFDPFFTTKEVGKGTGQGLAIVHSVVVEKHGGTIELESEVGRGTTFVIRMPIGLEPAERGGAAVDEAAHSVC